MADEHDLNEKLSFEERLEDQVRVMRPFRKPARSPKVLAGLIRLGGRGAASFYLLIFPARPSEGRYLRAIGVMGAAEVTADVAMMVQAFTYWFATATLIISGTVGPNLLWGARPGGALSGISLVLLVIVVPAGATLLCAVSAFAAENRLLASAFRAARLVRALSPDPMPSPERMTVETLLLLRRGTHRRDQVFQLLLRNTRYRRRVVAGVAWALTRDTARLTGRPPQAGATGGELLLWFAEHPQDRRRRPIVAAHLAELMNAVAREEPLPHAQFAPASRFRNRSPRERVLHQARGFASGALTTGVLVAIVTAVLRIWIK